MRLGLDIGGTKIAAVLLDDDGVVRNQVWREHSARGLEVVADALADVARETAADVEPTAVGVSVSGLVQRDGRITGGATLEIAGDLAGALARRLARPVQVANDAEATLRAVLFEHEAATGQHVRDAVLLTIGTGIGGAIVTDGRPVRGRSGLATELGHLPVRGVTEHRCVCGSSGCLEQFAGGKGIAALAERAIEDGGDSSLAVSAGAITTKDVVDAARAGDPLALELVEDAAAASAQALRALCVTVEPDLVFLGGSVAHGAADLLPARIEQHLTADWPFAGLTTPPEVRLDAVGPYAAAIGAALLTRDLDHSATAGRSMYDAQEGIDD